MHDNAPLFARKIDGTRPVTLQSLRDHLIGAAKLAQSFEKEFDALAGTATLLHDVGKATEQFQRYLLNGEGQRGSVIHAWQGAFIVDDIDAQSARAKIVQEILEMAIAKHHGELPDCVDLDDMTTFFDQFRPDNKADTRFSYNEVKKNLPHLHLDVHRNFDAATAEFNMFLAAFGNSRKSLKNKNNGSFFLGLLLKYVYSRLVDADRLDAAAFETQTPHVPYTAQWDELIKHFETNITAFDTSTAIDRFRNDVSQACLHAADKPTGIYRLSVPTGGGKTLASLNFALHHAKKTGKKHIIYVIPYLSITSQTVQSFKYILDLPDDNDVLLEHYSNAGVTDDITDGDITIESAQEQIRRTATERWDSPIIVTTMVQFLETVMSARSTKLRKFHNMADSVIIFDEIQALPVNAINLFNETVSFLSTILNTTILLCSATQPLLERTKRQNLALAKDPNLITMPKRGINHMRRTNIIASCEPKTLDQFADIIFEQAQRNGSCLAIVNLKSEAKAIYRRLVQMNVDRHITIVHLSTSMCGKHRNKRINDVKQLLSSEQPVICVSTQLIEAGVDISFNCVVRAMAGLDSILQAAGRCNRNGKSPTPRPVYVYPIADEKGLHQLSDIQIGKEITGKIIRENPDIDLLSDSAINQYYDHWLNRFDAGGGKFDYPIEGERTAYDLLSDNHYSRDSYQYTTGKPYTHCFAQSFKTVSNEFRVIPNLAQTVVVPYGQALQLLDRLRTADFPTAKVILHYLQDYTVSLFNQEYETLMKVGAISTADETFGIELLDASHYNDEYGVDLHTEQPIMFV